MNINNNNNKDLLMTKSTKSIAIKYDCANK